MPGDAAKIVVDVVDVVVDLLMARLQLSDRSLQRLHSIITLVADLGQPNELKVSHPLLQIRDAGVKVGAPVVGDDGGGVLG
jgi:hypothetical protein